MGFRVGVSVGRRVGGGTGVRVGTGVGGGTGFRVGAVVGRGVGGGTGLLVGTGVERGARGEGTGRRVGWAAVELHEEGGEADNSHIVSAIQS
jgi:hypothetical protein